MENSRRINTDWGNTCSMQVIFKFKYGPVLKSIGQSLLRNSYDQASGDAYHVTQANIKVG